MEGSLKRKLGYYINYKDVDYEIVDENSTLELKMPSNGKLGQILHEYIQRFLIDGIVSIDKSYSPFYTNLEKAIELVITLLGNEKPYYCEKKIERIGNVKLVGQADICSDNVVIELKSNSDLKKVDLMQALIYTYLYERDVILFLYGIYSGEYRIIRVPFNERNINSLFEGIKKVNENE